jgi:hypothetical protein
MFNLDIDCDRRRKRGDFSIAGPYAPGQQRSAHANPDKPFICQIISSDGGMTSG